MFAGYCIVGHLCWRECKRMGPSFGRL